MNSYTLVNVVYPPEAEMMLMQARSMARFVEPDVFVDVLIIEQQKMPDGWQHQMIEAYKGRFNLRFMDAEQFCMPMAHGWFQQQLIKLLAAQVLYTSHYHIMDAKQHFVRPFGMRDLQNKDGVPWIFRYCQKGSWFRRFIIPTLDYLGLPHTHLERMVGSGPPLTMKRDLVLSLCDHRPDFREWFTAFQVSEYGLMWLWGVKQGMIDSWADESQNKAGCVWETWANTDQGLGEVQRAWQVDYRTFAVHRRSFAKLRGDVKEEIANLWFERGLFSDRQQGLAYLDAEALKTIGNIVPVDRV